MFLFNSFQFFILAFLALLNFILSVLHEPSKMHTASVWYPELFLHWWLSFWLSFISRFARNIISVKKNSNSEEVLQDGSKTDPWAIKSSSPFLSPVFFLLSLPYSFLVVIISWSNIIFCRYILLRHHIKYCTDIQNNSNYCVSFVSVEIVWSSNRNGLCAINSEGNYSGRGMGGTCEVNGLKQIVLLNDGI